MDIDDPVRRQPGRGKRRRVDIALLQKPQDLTRHPGKQSGREQGRRRAVLDLRTASGGKRPVDRLDAEWDGLLA